ncbi:MAG: hypothetical protein SOR61_05990 [Evtepia sp.]|uniref:hypothetical protein n=1 Tax=Evtepia sp. TaxID=2773933 RepID=UPI002A759D93|nr:hypothetical protein [Evtepia sp.]MDY3014724.1 hypothetical protein [Evtepia sp.]
MERTNKGMNLWKRFFSSSGYIIAWAAWFCKGKSFILPKNFGRKEGGTENIERKIGRKRPGGNTVWLWGRRQAPAGRRNRKIWKKKGNSDCLSQGGIVG